MNKFELIRGLEIVINMATKQERYHTSVGPVVVEVSV